MPKRLNPVLWNVRIRRQDRSWANITNRVKRLYIESLRDQATGYQTPGYCDIDFYDPTEEFHPVDQDAQSIEVRFNGKRIFRQLVEESKSSVTTGGGSPVNSIHAEDNWRLMNHGLWDYNSYQLPQRVNSFVQAILISAGQTTNRLNLIRKPASDPNAGSPREIGRQLVPGSWSRNFNGITGRRLLQFAQDEEGGDAYVYLRQDSQWAFKPAGHRALITTPPVATIRRSSRIRFEDQRDLVRTAVELEYPGKWEQLGYGVFYTNPETPIALKANVPLVIHATPISGGGNTVNTAQYEQNPQGALVLVPGIINPSQVPISQFTEDSIDYRANATADPESTNKTSVVTATIANDPEPQFTITLTATEDCYLTKLQARTFGLFILDRTPTRIYRETGTLNYKPVHKIECYWTREHAVADAITSTTLAEISRAKPTIWVDLVDSEDYNIAAFTDLSIGDKVRVSFKGRDLDAFVDGHQYIYQEESAIRRLQLRQA